MTVGILALQGDYAAHSRMLDRLNVPWVFVTTPEQLSNVNALIMPGGESTAMLKLMQALCFTKALKAFYQRNKAILATCAGLILLAKTVEPEQQSLALLDISVKRNAYGRQLDSFVASAKTTLDAQLLEMVFIRAPQIIKVGTKVNILGYYQQQPVLVQQKRLLAATFHPELTTNCLIHRYFIGLMDNPC